MVQHVKTGEVDETQQKIKKLNPIEREDVLGFKPQKEVVYNSLLPYADLLDEESAQQFAEIKSQIGLSILLRDVKIGGMHWIGQLSKYIRLYGMKISMEDHIQLIKLLYEIICIPDMQYSLIQKYASTLTTLLKKSELIPRGSLVLPWRPLFRLYDYMNNNPFEHHGLVFLPESIDMTMKYLVRACRVYFSVESTREMLEEWRPLMCPFDLKMGNAMNNFEHFLPTLVYPEEHDQTFKLWFDEFMALYCSTTSSPSWESSLLHLFTRLAHDCYGYIDWDKYSEELFTRILREFELPVGSKKVEVKKHYEICEIGVMSKWIIYMITPSGEAMGNMSKLFKALESFYHPSNHGKWTGKLLKFLSKLSVELVKRLERERWRILKDDIQEKINDWRPEIQQNMRLTEDDLTTFVKLTCPALMSAMFSKNGSTEASVTFKNFSIIRPEIVIPPLLEWTYPALETLIEPHRLIACLQCTVSVARSMVINPQRYPDGPSHVIPLFQLSLPGIDPNDLKKSMMTFQLITTLASLIPIVDCSDAPKNFKDLNKHELQLCAATANFEEVVLMYFDRVILMIENSVHHHSRNDTATSDKMSNEEFMLELCLLSSTNSLLQQTSLKIFKEVLQKIQNFTLGAVFETRVAGKFASKLIKAASKARPELVLPKFVPFCCSLLIKRLGTEDLSKEEHLDNEILWNLMLLAEIVACDGKFLVAYSDDLVKVLDLSLNLKCKEAADLSGNILKHVLRSLSSIYATDYRSTTLNWDNAKNLPIREWGKSADLFNLNLKWHITSPQEKAFVRNLIGKFLLTQLNKIKQHCSGDKSQMMDREELCRSLNIIHYCMFGACSLLPMWSDGPVPFVKSPVALKRFSLIASLDEEGITVDGRNVRLMIVEHLKLLLDFMPCDKSDDTKSLLVIIKVVNVIFHMFSSSKDKFDGRWKARHHIKQFMANRLLGKKKHIRSLLVDRIQLQHDLRSTNQSTKYFTEHHRMFYKYLFQLATSRYMEIRKSAQSNLALCFRTFAYTYQVLVDDIVDIMQKKPSDDKDDHRFKGALYVILGDSKQSLVTRRNWDSMNKLWPALVLTPYCEKSSVNEIHDSIVDKIHKDIETTEIAMKVTPACIKLAEELWSRGSLCSVSITSDKEMRSAEEFEANCNKNNLESYYKLVDKLTTIAKKGNLYWRFQQVCFELLSFMIRHDIEFPSASVQLFIENMNNSMINIRKVAIHAVSALLKQQKRHHPKSIYDPLCSTLPYGSSTCQSGMKPEESQMQQIVVDEFSKAEDIRSAGIKKRNSSLRSKPHSSQYSGSNHVPPTNNGWLLYWSKDVPCTEEQWNDFVFINKTHIGYYAWPKALIGYQPLHAQPKLGRSPSELSKVERPIYDAFNDPGFVKKFVNYMSMEEHKGKESFHPKNFTFFKGLFRNYDDTVLPQLKKHVELLVSDTNHDSMESHHRCAAEIIAGLLRGSKHWTFKKRENMWAWLIPILRKVINNLSVETIYDWGTCIATSSESQDPRKLMPLFSLLMENPLSEVGGSFGDSSRLYLLQGLLAQQEWRVPELLHKLLDFLTRHLKHLYKNVRDRIGSILVNIFLFDVSFYSGFPSTPNPQLNAFLEIIMPKLLLLMYLGEKKVATSDGSSAASPDRDDHRSLSKTSPHFMDTYNPDYFLSSDEAQKSIIRLFKTVLKGLQGVYTRLFQTDHPDILKLLPVMASLESYTMDVELGKECSMTMAIMSYSLLSNVMVIPMLDAIEEVSRMSSWHARLSILNFLQRMSFGNLFLLQKPEIISRINSMLLVLLMDEQLEVRELAGVTLSGLFQCSYLTVNGSLVHVFKQWASTKINKKAMAQKSHADNSIVPVKPVLPSLTSSAPSGLDKGRSVMDPGTLEKIAELSLVKRHAGVIGMCACVSAAPYDVPAHVPDLLVTLSYHLNDPQPIQMTVKRAMGGFKRTHHENWQDHKQKFTDDQLGILTELLVSPNYYA